MNETKTYHLVLGGFFCQVRSVTLLPQELTSAQEGLGVLELPSHDGVPLVQDAEAGHGGCESTSRSRGT